MGKWVWRSIKDKQISVVVRLIFLKFGKNFIIIVLENPAKLRSHMEDFTPEMSWNFTWFCQPLWLMEKDQWKHFLNRMIMASLITGNYTFCSSICSAVHQRKRYSSTFLVLCEGNFRDIGGLPHKGPVTRKLLPCPLQWHHNECNDVSSHRVSIDCLIVGSGADQGQHPSSTSLALCMGNSPVTGEFPAQRASNAENQIV